MFRFTIRDVLWLMVIVALVLGWAVYARKVQAELNGLRGQLVIEVKARGAMADTFVRWLQAHQYTSGIDAKGRVEVYYVTWTEIIDPFKGDIRSGPASSPRDGEE